MGETADFPCVCVAVRKASRRLTSLYDAAVAPAGINVAQFSLLKAIRRHGPLSLTRLSDIVELDRSTLGRNVRVIERLGLVQLEPGADQREARVQLSDEGEATLERAMPLWRATQQRIHDRLGAERAAELTALLSAL
jgi:DNA-binding MarR family transcriptional regulator